MANGPGIKPYEGFNILCEVPVLSEQCSECRPCPTIEKESEVQRLLARNLSVKSSL
jgi:hypothetical protein